MASWGATVLAVALALSAGLSCRITEDERQLWLYSYRVFYPGDDVEVELQTEGVDAVEMAVYPIDLAAAAEHPDLDLHSLTGIDFAGVKPILTWTEDVEEQGYWSYETMKIPLEEEGAYLVRASAGKKAAATLVVINRIALVVKTDDDSLVAYAAERMTGEPVEGVEVLTFPRVAEGLVTDADGLAVKNGIVLPEDESSFLVLGRKGDGVTPCDSYFGYYESERYKGYTYTDRPVYRPGQTVHMKGILRRYVGSEYVNLPGKAVKVEVKAPSGDPAFKVELTTSEFGSFASEFTLGEEPPLGRYNINTSFDDQTFTSYFDVEEYRKPEYEVAVTTHKDYYLAGDVLVFDVTGRYYFGEPVARADVDYTVYRQAKYYYGWRVYRYSWYYDYDDYYDYYGWEYVADGEGQLDDDGHFRGTTAIPAELSYNYEYRVDAVMTDASRREVTSSATAPVWRAGLALYAYLDKYFYEPGDPAIITFQSRDPLGRPYPADVVFEITMQRWEESETTGRGKWLEVAVKKDEVSIGESGDARYRFVPDENGYYTVKAKAFDEGGAEVDYNVSFYVADESYYHSYYSGSGVTLTLDKESYQPGDVALAMVQTDKAGSGVLLTLEGDELYRAQVVRPEGNTALVEIPIENKFAPNVYLSAYVVADDSFTNAQADVIVPPEDRFLNVEIKPNKDEYKPREGATFAVTATDWRGAPVKAEISLGVADESVYAIKAEAAPDI
ncbi:MAG TPA: MG2 domain-containing protein, partial [bacterium]|nr:MG2 domain-containing protein [bacterium]